MMCALLRIELRKACGTLWFWGTLALCCLVSGAAAIDAALYATTFSSFAEGAAQTWIGMSPLSSFAAWIGVGTLFRTPLQQFYFYLMPLAVLLPHAWSLRSEMRTGYIDQLYTRAPRWQYVVAKGIAVFLSAAALVALSLILNIVLTACFIPAYQLTPADELYLGMSADSLWGDLFYSTPALYMAIDVLVCSVMLGLFAVLGYGLSFIVKSPVLLVLGVYLGAVFAKYLNEEVVFLVLGGVRGFMFNPIDILQGQNGEYMRDGWIMAAMGALWLVVACIVSALRVKGDVLCDSSDA